MACLDDAGKTTILYHMMLDTAVTAIHRFQRRECGTQKHGAHCLGHCRRSRIPGQTANPKKLTVPEGIKEEQTFEAVVYPSASMEEKAEIPEGREAWSDHRLHTERAYTD